MKLKAILQFIVCFATLCGTTYAQSGKPTTLKGKINGYNGQETVFFADPLNDPGEDIQVNPDGTFTHTTRLEKPIFDAFLTIEQYLCRFYIEPGGSYNFIFDLSDESLYEITGSNKAENEIWKRYIFKYYYTSEIIDEFRAHSQNFKTYESYINSFQQTFIKDIEQTKNSSFIPEMKKRVNEITLFNLYLYALLEAEKTGNVVNDPDFNKWLTSRKWSTLDEKALAEWNRLSNTITYNFKEIDKLVALKTLKKCIPENKILNTLATAVMIEYFAQGGKGDREKTYNYYKTICTNPELIAQVETSYENTKFLSEGSAAPDFTMKDINGKEYKLSDFRGKVVYIDVWATWCGPCKVQIPHFEKLAQKFRNDNRIEFISISIDDNTDAWKKMLEHDKPEWPQFIIQGEAQDDFSKKYQITGIPRFMLFDPQGNIISVNAPFPSQEKISEYLETLLSEKYTGHDMEGEGNWSNSFDEFYSKWRGKNKIAPDFTAYDIDGNQVKLSDFKNKVVVLDFWFTTCHMCIKGFPAMEELAAKYASQNLIVIAAGTPEKKEDFERFVKNNREKYPHLIWVQDRSSNKFEGGIAMKHYGIFGAPSQIIINKEGIVISATNFKEQIIASLPLAGIDVDARELQEAQIHANQLEERVRKTLSEDL